ncbi:hypothetical protein AJ80_04905 [Polytolypa hystricis UAMH7299]|uniref:Elongator complex protein 5 n=1 Tax=Polytolypa hystricis (strain UAMH7299) TaxID=1447883 RepID=A0A2B7Y8A1_POLH7|nr:hypothetical protein AJ80_04905 [Polytolypa hystricis UAMH7299]
MASSTNLAHRRTHNLLLISKLLNLRDSASPLTLVIDSLEQPASPLIAEYIRRAKLSKVLVTYVSFETLTRPHGVDTFISTRRKSLAEIAKEVNASYSGLAPSVAASNAPGRRTLVIIDSIHAIISRKRDGNAANLAPYLSSLLGPPSAQMHTSSSLIAVCHQDIPMPPNSNPYTPSPMSLLSYLATSILTVHSLDHILARKAASDRSLMPPVFGLDEELDGVVIGRIDDANRKSRGNEGVVLEMEHRRKSGRGVVEWYFLPPAASYSPQHVKEVVTLLDDHPLYRHREDEEYVSQESTEPESTFELGLTERQRREREGVVLPYFDAQKGGGPGEGGRILYDMGEEDDFDEEEDEI